MSGIFWRTFTSTLALALLSPLTQGAENAPSTPGVAAFRLWSPDLQGGQTLGPAQVYKGFGCQGGNQSPALTWEGAPAETRSFALTVYDPDAPTGSGWWHWQIYDLPPAINSLPAGAGDPNRALAPTGSVQGLSDYGEKGFGGACPPAGDKPHRYVFTLYALDEEHLNVPENPTAAMVGYALHLHTLARASFTATYGR